MAVAFSGFSSFIEIRLADTVIPFVSSWTASQARSSSNIVYTVSNSATAAGAAQQQISWNVEIEIPVSVLAEFAVDINDIAIGDGTQISCTLNRPSSNNDQLDFTGTSYTFSNIAPDTNSLTLRDGEFATQTISFLAGKLNVSQG